MFFQGNAKNLNINDVEGWTYSEIVWELILKD